MPDPDEQFLITVEEAVATYGVSERTIWRWLGDGRLRRYRREGDRATRVDRREVERLRRWRER